MFYKTDCGEVHGQIDCGYGDVLNVSLGNRYLALNIDRGVGPLVIDVWEVSWAVRFCIKLGQIGTK